MHRRTLLKSALALTLATAVEPTLLALNMRTFVIDSHIHLFDPTRPGGVPWPEKANTLLYHPALPSRYARVAQQRGVVGAIAIECSPWLVDNFWLQDIVEKNPIMLGFIGDLAPDATEFAATLDKLHRSPLFLGIRYGNLWNRDLGAAAQKPDFLSGLRLLAQAGLVMETANPDPDLIAAVLQVSDRVPELRIVIDHLPHVEAPADAGVRARYEANLRELSQHGNIFVKGSEIVRNVNGRAMLDAGYYQAALDKLWELFGEERIFFGSDWPNSDSVASYDETFGVAQRYIATRSVTAQQKYFWRNSRSVYNWRPRTLTQSQLARS
jgi:L-fuconolactonase